MSKLHQAWAEIPLEGDLQLITADQIRLLSGREPRLMMKFDHSSQLPPALKESGRFILPLKNGLYALLKGQGYHRPESCGAPLDFPRQTRFELRTTDAGISEMQHLDLAFNIGLLGHFLGEPVLYPTIRGRKRSPKFEFIVGPHRLEVEGVQVEIDGGFEGRNTVTLVEAKIGESEDFHLRQLYYPLRFWSTLTKKRVRLVFFTYEPETELYRFREYGFDPEEVYQAPLLLKAACYRIVEAAQRDFTALTVSNEFPFPQADRLDKVALIPFLVSEGIVDPQQLAEALEFTPRQGRYYLDACKSLGLLDHQGALTALGSDYLTCPPEIRYRQLCKAVMALPVMQEILSTLMLAPDSTMKKHEVQAVVQRATGLAPSTAARRTQTVWSWLGWLSHFSESLRLEGESLVVGRSEPADKAEPEPTRPRQLDLFEGD